MRTTRPTRSQMLAAAILALGGGLTILYSGFMPFPPLSDAPVPLLWSVFGILELVAAGGVLLGRPWGRAIGLGVIAVDLVLLVFRLMTQVPVLDPLDLLANVTVSIVATAVPDLIVLWVLLRRWPKEASRSS